MGLHFVHQILILVELVFQLVHAHNLAEHIVILLIELFILILDIAAQLQPLYIIKEPARAGGKSLLHGAHHIGDHAARQIQHRDFREKLRCDHAADYAQQHHHNQRKSRVAQAMLGLGMILLFAGAALYALLLRGFSFLLRGVILFLFMRQFKGHAFPPKMLKN